MTKNMVGTTGNILLGAAGTATTFSLAHANECLAFASGVLTVSFMAIKLYRLLKKVLADDTKQAKQELKEETTT
jgi:hypothetical protein